MNRVVNNAECVSDWGVDKGVGELVLDEWVLSYDCVFTSMLGCFENSGGGVTSKAAFYLPVIIAVDNLFVLSSAGVSPELFFCFSRS